MEQENKNTETISGNRIKTLLDPRKYRGSSANKKFPKRLTTWIKHTAQAGFCGDLISEESFHDSGHTKLESGAVPGPFEKSEEERTWDHTYCREIIEKEIRTTEEQEAGDKSNLEIKFEPVNLKRLNEAKKLNKPCKGVQLRGGKAAWRSNLTFMKTYSRKLSFKDPNDSMEWTAIEPGCAEDNVGELRASETLKQSIAAVKTTTTDTLIRESENREIRELRIMNIDLRRQNRLLKIENFKLQLRLATANKKKSER